MLLVNKVPWQRLLPSVALGQYREVHAGKASGSAFVACVPVPFQELILNKPPMEIFERCLFLPTEKRITKVTLFSFTSLNIFSTLCGSPHFPALLPNNTNKGVSPEYLGSIPGVSTGYPLYFHKYRQYMSTPASICQDLPFPANTAITCQLFSPHPMLILYRNCTHHDAA